MAFSKIAITLSGANYILQDLKIEIIALPTGGYQALSKEKNQVIDADA